MKLNIHIATTIILSTIALVNAKLAMIIRHGEKTSDETTNLSPRGKARAFCLINAFGTNGTFVTPQKIYAQSPTEKKQSTRPRDTVVPLSDVLGLEVDLSYTSGQIKKLTKNIKSTSEDIVLVSWSNDNIPEIAEKFGITNPPKWDGNIFDDIWMIYDSTTPSFYHANSNNKRDIIAGNEGFSMEIIKQNVDECINENISRFSQNVTSNSIKSYSSIGTYIISFLYMFCLFVSMIIIY